MKKLFWLLSFSLLYSVYSYAVYYVKWGSVSGCTYDWTTNTLIKSGTNWTNCIAISVNKLKPEEEGYVSYNIGGLINRYRFFGLSNFNTVGTYQSVKYAFFIYNNNLSVYESGQPFPLPSANGSNVVQANDILVVERLGANIYPLFKKNKKWGNYNFIYKYK